MENSDYNIKLVSNYTSSNMFNEINISLLECKSFIFSVAFINFGGLQLLVKSLDELRSRNISGKVLTSDYLNFTDPKALRKLLEFSNIETKVYLQEKYGGFHTKAYIFEFENEIKLFIGSSNITENALLRNIEWNVKIISKKEHPLIEDIYYQFNQLWEKTQIVDDSFLFEYEKFVQDLKEFRRNEEKFVYRDITVTPNTMQLRAIQQLHRLRTRGEDRGLVIAATATGKTYMSAFDVQQFNPERMLFIVHREDILIKAEESFRKVLGSKIDAGILSGNHKDFNAKYLFTTIQSLNNHYQRFGQNTFDYIVVDEAHHAVAESYIKMLDYFKPKFILGMTATPERTDGFQLFSLFKNNIALEIRLYDAIESDLVVPFHYFGITEAEGIDLSTVDENDALAITHKLSVHHRVTYIIEKLKLYGHDGGKLKALGFCASLEHAQYMKEEFNKLGIRSEFLSGANSVDERTKAVLSLESNETDSLEVIFTRDVFNEGIDIPSVNTVLMLRPTNSPIIFIQQLGRGLRKFDDKSFVTVLDFIGNYRKSFMIALALKGSQYIDKDSLKVAVKNNFAGLPGTAFVQMDEISKEQILKQLELENFNSLKYLKDEYFEFKRTIKRIPFYLMDYELYEGSPDPTRYIDKERSYPEFLLKIEDIAQHDYSYLNESIMKLIRQLSRTLPIKSPFEFILLKLLLNKSSIKFEDYNNEVRAYIENVPQSTLIYSIENMIGQFKDRQETVSYKSLILWEQDNLFISRSSLFSSIIASPVITFIKDIIEYGLTRYTREFDLTSYIYPFFHHYQSYRMTDAALLSNDKRTTSSYRGQGLITNGKEYFIYVDLHKEADIKESINYRDRILDAFTMQWESQNKTKTTSPNGQNMIHNLDRGINLHMFVRKFKKVDGMVQPYIYLGLVDTVSYENEQPIRFIFKFRKPIPSNLLEDLTSVVKLN